MRYLVVVEKGPKSYGAYVPDLPGCVAAGESREEVLTLIHEAIELHLESLKEEGRTPSLIPHPAVRSLRFTPPNYAFEPTPEQHRGAAHRWR